MARGIVVAVLALLAACGGGGDDGPTLAAAPVLPFISVSLTGSTNALAIPPRTVVTASAQLWQQTPTGAPISNATISVNGTALTLDAATNRYSASIDAAPGAAITINVAVNGANYTAATTLLSGSPTLTSPGVGTSWNAAADNTIQWSNAPGSDATSFGAAIHALSLSIPPTSTQLWPASGALQSVASGATSVVVPRNSLSPCRCMALVSASRVASFPGAASGSMVAVFATGSTSVTVN